MYINDCGVNQTHESTFIVDRPTGSGDYLFIFTRTPILLISNNTTNRYPIETTVFFHKGMDQRFMAAGSTYADDFIHFYADGEDEEFIKSLNIPHATPFLNLDSSIFLNIHKYICIEKLSTNAHHDIAINSLLRYFLIKLSQAITEASMLTASTSIRTQMNELRSEIYSNVSVNWTISQLASKMNLSESYFQATYKQMFSRSAISDVIIARINKAKFYLSTTDYSISRVAQLCGYDNDSHFAKQFKKVTGITASEYRRDSKK